LQIGGNENITSIYRSLQNLSSQPTPVDHDCPDCIPATTMPRAVKNQHNLNAVSDRMEMFFRCTEPAILMLPNWKALEKMLSIVWDQLFLNLKKRYLAIVKGRMHTYKEAVNYTRGNTR
jgi:hypothetical protein